MNKDQPSKYSVDHLEVLTSDKGGVVLDMTIHLEDFSGLEAITIASRFINSIIRTVQCESETTSEPSIAPEPTPEPEPETPSEEKPAAKRGRTRRSSTSSSDAKKDESEKPKRSRRTAPKKDEADAPKSQSRRRRANAKAAAATEEGAEAISDEDLGLACTEAAEVLTPKGVMNILKDTFNVDAYHELDAGVRQEFLDQLKAAMEDEE